MKTRLHPVRIGIVSLGCSKTLVDSEVILGKLHDARYCLVDDPGSCDVVLLNTCGFIKDAKQESIDTLLRLIALKREKKLAGLVVLGCLVQRYARELEKEFPEVDAFIGSGDYDGIAAILKKVTAGQKLMSLHRAGYLSSSVEKRVSLTPRFYRYLKISEGCNHRCSFCVIPELRGKFRSRGIADVVAEAKALVKEGARELVLIGQDITKFGYDYAKRPLLPDLLSKLEEIKDLRWIRLLYAYPSSVTEAMILTMARSSKVLHYLDLPLQHISDRILTAMRRGFNRKKTLALISQLRAAMPGMVLRTSFIVGFPGETEREFRELLDFMEEVRFERLGIFSFSPEQGSPAAAMPHQVPEQIKSERYHRAMQLQQRIAREASRRLRGKTLEVLVEAKDAKLPHAWLGRSFMDAPEVDGSVVLYSSRSLRTGRFYPVLITDTKAYDLVGKV